MGIARSSKLIIVAVLAVALAACAPPASRSDSTDKLAGFKEETATRLTEIETELEGLDREERRAALIEMAEEEGGVMTLYGVTPLDIIGEQIDAFEEETGVTVNYFRADSLDVVQRLTEEADADFRGADAINENGPEMTILDREGLLARIDSPIAEDLPPEGVDPVWLWSYIDMFVPGWNTETVSAKEAPKTWEDVLTRFKGRLGMEAGDYDWFAALVEDYFMAQEGMSESEAVDLFRTAGRGATFIAGHTLMTELLVAGEFDVAASPYAATMRRFEADGAPVEWEPAVAPIVARPEGVAIHATAEHPAGALLFIEFYLDEGQEIGLEQSRQPASQAVEGGGLPEGYDTIVVDAEAVIDEYEKWSSLYDEIVGLSGSEVVEDE